MQVSSSRSSSSSSCRTDGINYSTSQLPTQLFPSVPLLRRIVAPLCVLSVLCCLSVASGADPCCVSFPRQFVPHPITAPNHLYLTSMNFDAHQTFTNAYFEWIAGPVLANQLNVTYVHTPFYPQQPVWAQFFGWNQGEVMEEDVLQIYGEERVMVKWIDRQQFQQIETVLRPLIEDYGKAPVLLKLRYLQSTPSTLACDKQLNRRLRAKYCLARMSQPITDVFASERLQGKVSVAVHVQTTQANYVNIVATLIQHIAGTIGVTHSIVFHLFFHTHVHASEQSSAATAGSATDPTNENLILSHPFVAGQTIVSHPHFHHLHAVHHLITSDILVASGNGVSLIASMLHSTTGIVIAPAQACDNSIVYDPNGHINEAQLKERWNAYASRHFDKDGKQMAIDRKVPLQPHSIEECHRIADGDE